MSEIIILGQIAGKSKGGGNYRHVRLDASSESLKILEYSHTEVHDGSAFRSGFNYVLANGDVASLALTTPASPVEMHTMWYLGMTADGSMRVLEDVTSYTGGTAVTPLNHNRNSSKVSGATIKRGMTGVTPITPTGGTQILGTSFTVARDDNFDRSNGFEFILKTGSTYLFEYTNGTSANQVTWRFEWYEHTPKN